MTVTINGSGTIGGISVGGLNDNIITKNEMATGGAWAPAGTVLQVVQATYNTITSTSSVSYVTSGLSASITPSSSSSKILVRYSIPTGSSNSSAQATSTIYRNSTNLAIATLNNQGFSQMYASATQMQSSSSGEFLDSPATTSATTYTVYIASTNGGQVQYFPNNVTGSITLMEIAA